MNIPALVAVLMVADSGTTPERVTLPIVDGTTFELVLHANGAATDAATTPSGTVAVLIELDASSDPGRTVEPVAPGSTPAQVPGAAAWGREWPVWLPMRETNVRFVFQRLGRPNRNSKRWLLIVVRDARRMTVVADSSSIEKAQALALSVGRNAEWAPLERDPLLIGCFLNLESSEAMCLRPDGSFVSADGHSKKGAWNLCRNIHDGRWATGDRKLTLQDLDGRRILGPYQRNGELLFNGRRWARAETCAAASR